MKSFIIILIVGLFCATSIGQELWITAENGLNVRYAPDAKSNKVGKFFYADQVSLIERTGKRMRIKDGAAAIEGEWVLVEGTNEDNKQLRGYLFDGYLTSDLMHKTFTVDFEKLVVDLPNLEVFNFNEIKSRTSKNNVNILLGLGSSPDGQVFKIKKNTFKKVAIFQRYENSITIMNEGPHCDLVDWKHYNSPWESVKFDTTTTTFVGLEYTEEDWAKFTSINMDELRTEVKKKCGEQWSKLIENTKDPNEYPSGVGTSRIFIKIIGTNEDDTEQEMLITFETQMGC